MKPCHQAIVGNEVAIGADNSSVIVDCSWFGFRSSGIPDRNRVPVAGALKAVWMIRSVWVRTHDRSVSISSPYNEFVIGFPVDSDH